MRAYLDILRNVCQYGIEKPNRTGINTISVTGETFRHDMRTGFPISTTKKVSIKLIASELEMFIKGYTSKEFLQKRNNHIWDEWCNPTLVPYGNDEKTKELMKSKDDLGPIYGYQWRSFGLDYKIGCISLKDPDYPGDQLKYIVDTLKKNPNDRRMLCSAWNPLQLKEMALPPCHYAWQVVCQGENLEYIDLIFNMRSVDCGLGMVYDIASYGILLELLAKESGKTARMLIGTFGDCHIYKNHLDAIIKILERDPLPLPTIEFKKFSTIFDFEYEDVILNNYQYHPPVKMEIAV